VENPAIAQFLTRAVEILVPLTWPLERDEQQLTANHYQHTPYLQLAQVSYKKEALKHWSSSVLRAAIRIALPSITLPVAERSQRDEGIIKLVLYFLRNIALISPPPNLPAEWDEDDISRSATIKAFHNEDVLSLLLLIASNIGGEFNTQDVVVLEVLFHLLKGINVEKLFMDDVELDQKKSKDLQGLMAKEAAMLKSYSKNAPTRHNRFGTMIWVKRDDEKVSTVSGQDVLKDEQYTMAKMDQTKRWIKPKQRKKEQRTTNHFDFPTSLDRDAKIILRSFVKNFLDSGFNPLFAHLRRAIEREAERVLQMHSQQFLYLVGWFLEAERARKARKRRGNQKSAVQPSHQELDGYTVIASVLNQETFILINKLMQDWLDTKLWLELDAGMRCFTQVLLTVQEMSESSIEEDQEIADNIQSRIFYEESTHDRVVSILKGYKDQNFSYLDACTELSHVFLRMLERYSKTNLDLQIRSKRKAQRKKKKPSTTEPETEAQQADQDSEAEDQVEAQRVSRERKFDFTRLSAKFVTQSCVNTFVAFTSYYKDLSTEQLKRAHRFFHRVAFKQEMSVILFRLDIISLFYRMIKGPEPINTASTVFGEWQELVKQLFRRLVKQLQERPELSIELLFSKIPATTFYLEHGYEKQTVSAIPRAPADLEVKGTLPRINQIAVVVAVLCIKDIEHVIFVEGALLSAASERESWEKESAARDIENNVETDPEQTVERPKPPSIGK
jgi:replication fork protection complex subunit Tof1/Swi1